jgi:ubiquinone/menaquinone biosynthesis C-methylase UbiE
MWALKIVAKLILSRLHLPYRMWAKLGVFRHGHMETAQYVVSVFTDHVRNAFPNGLPPGATVLELGGGDSLASALVAKAYGAGRIYLVDVGAFARTDVEFYKKMTRRLAEMGLDVPDIRNAATLSEILSVCNAEYLTGGLESLRRIPSQSVDLVWSQAVLEHVRRASFEATMMELSRILKSDGKASHVVDFKDHLANALNHLRFSETLWESDLFASSGFYTNRIQAPTMLEMFRRCGFENIHVLREWRWNSLPIRSRAIDRSFRHVPEADLLISCIMVTMSRRHRDFAKERVA